MEDAHEEKAAYIGFSELQGQAVWLQNFFSRRQQADALRAHEVAIRTLVSAAQRGDLNTLRSLRAEGADLRAHADLLANTAIASGQVDVVRFLHENGFLASACSLESIRSALKSHHWSTLNYVFQQGCQIPAEILKDDVLYAPRSGPDEDIVAQAKDHLRGSVKAELIAYLPDAGRRWKTYALWSRSVIPHLHSATEVIRFAQNAHGHGGFESRQEGDELLSYVAKLESHLASRFPTYANEFASFTESDGSDDSTSLVFNGHRVSGPMYANMTFFLESLTHMPVFPNSVCEIGGGYGGPCRLWLSNNIHRPSRYVIVDLPESLFFSEVFLRHEFGRDKVHYIDSARPIDARLFDEFQVLLCSVPYIGSLINTHFDLIFNTLSMQEMSSDYVDFYSNWLDRQPVSYFYSFNYAAQPFDAHPESANRCAPVLSKKWNPVWVADYAAEPSPAMHILARKDEQLTDLAIRARGAELLSEYLDKECNNVTFITLMMAARMADDAAATCKVIEKVLNEMPIVPRELSVLQELAGMQKCANGLSADCQGVIRRAAEALHCQDVREGGVAPYLQAIHASLLSPGDPEGADS